MSRPTEYQRHTAAGAKINGQPVTSAQTCREGDYYRWIIRTARATYVDGGNFSTREAAIAGMRDALEAAR